MQAESAQTGIPFPVSLAEKYRPQTIAEFVGLERPKKVLSAFSKRPTSGAWLFVGPSGVGKSTMALALAGEIQAELHKIPSQKCNAQTIEDTVRHCWYAPMTPGGFHVVLADEADQMTNAAQLALLSKLDSTDPAPNTIWIFTANDIERLERRFSLAAILQLRSIRSDSRISRQGVARGGRERKRARLGASPLFPFLCPCSAKLAELHNIFNKLKRRSLIFNFSLAANQAGELAPNSFANWRNMSSLEVALFWFEKWNSSPKPLKVVSFREFVNLPVPAKSRASSSLGGQRWQALVAR